MKRSVLGLTMAAAGLSPVLVAAPATAVTAPITAPVVSVAFRPAPTTLPVSDTLHFDAASGTVTRQMVGRPVAVTIASTASLDCASLSAGYQSAKGWRAVPVKVTSCTATRASATVTATHDMFGAAIVVSGWSQVPGTAASLSATWTARSGARSATAAASRTLLGRWSDCDVFATTVNGRTSVVVGRNSYAAPGGPYFHASVEHGDTLALWTREADGLHLWSLNLPTGAVTTQVIAQDAGATAPVVGTPGFYVHRAGAAVMWDAYSWDGTLRTTLYMGGINPVGFTDDALITKSSGLSGNTIAAVPMDGRPRVLGPGGGWGGVTVVSLNVHDVTYTYATPDYSSGTQTVVIHTCSLSSDGAVCRP